MRERSELIHNAIIDKNAPYHDTFKDLIHDNAYEWIQTLYELNDNSSHEESGKVLNRVMAELRELMNDNITYASGEEVSDV